MKKKYLVILLATMVVLASSVQIFAKEVNDLNYTGVTQTVSNTDNIVYFNFDTYSWQRNILIKQIGIGLTINNRFADIYTEGTTYENGTIKVKAELQRYENNDWTTLKTYTDTKEDTKECYIEKSVAVTQGYDYRVRTTVTVKIGSKEETITKIGTIQYCD